MWDDLEYVCCSAQGHAQLKMISAYACLQEIQLV